MNQLSDLELVLREIRADLRAYNKAMVRLSMINATTEAIAHSCQLGIMTSNQYIDQLTSNMQAMQQIASDYKNDMGVE